MSLFREVTRKILYHTYSTDLVDRAVFGNEILRWKARWTLAHEEEKPKSLNDKMSCKNKYIYPNVSKK